MDPFDSRPDSCGGLKEVHLFPFPILDILFMYSSKVEIFHHSDTMIEVQRTLKTSLIKADENLVALR